MKFYIFEEMDGGGLVIGKCAEGIRRREEEVVPNVHDGWNVYNHLAFQSP